MGKESPTPLERFNQCTLRERIVLLGATVLVLVAFTSLLLFQPWREQNTKLRRQIEAQRVTLLESKATESAIMDRSKNDPNVESRILYEALEKELQSLKQEFEASVVDLISPQEMPELLKDLLSQQKALKLLSLENLPSERVAVNKTKEDAQAEIPPLFRHRLRMSFSGDYLTTLKYLQKLQKLERSMVWEEVVIATQEYPETTISFQVYTLSLEEGWIGG